MKEDKENLESLSVKELRVILVGLGMPEDQVEAFETKKPLIATINTLRAATIYKESPKELREEKKHYQTKKEIMREKLMGQPLVRILVPLEGDEKPGVIKWVKNKRGIEEQVVVSGAYAHVQLNGYKYLVAKGVYQEVPEQIAEKISESQNMTLSAGRPFLVDRDDPKTGKKVIDKLE